MSHGRASPPAATPSPLLPRRNDTYRAATAKSECFPVAFINVIAPSDSFDINVTPDKRCALASRPSSPCMPVALLRLLSHTPTFRVLAPCIPSIRTVMFADEAGVLQLARRLLDEMFAAESCNVTLQQPQLSFAPQPGPQLAEAPCARGDANAPLALAASSGDKEPTARLAPAAGAAAMSVPADAAARACQPDAEAGALTASGPTGGVASVGEELDTEESEDGGMEAEGARPEGRLITRTAASESGAATPAAAAATPAAAAATPAASAAGAALASAVDQHADEVLLADSDGGGGDADGGVVVAAPPLPSGATLEDALMDAVTDGDSMQVPTGGTGGATSRGSEVAVARPAATYCGKRSAEQASLDDGAGVAGAGSAARVCLPESRDPIGLSPSQTLPMEAQAEVLKGLGAYGEPLGARTPAGRPPAARETPSLLAPPSQAAVLPRDGAEPSATSTSDGAASQARSAPPAAVDGSPTAATAPAGGAPSMDSLMSLVRSVRTQAADEQRSAQEELQMVLMTFAQQIRAVSSLTKETHAACHSDAAMAVDDADGGDGRVGTAGGLLWQLTSAACHYLRGWLQKHEPGADEGMANAIESGSSASLSATLLNATLAAAGWDWEAHAFFALGTDGTPAPPDPQLLSDAFASLADTLVDQRPSQNGGAAGSGVVGRAVGARRQQRGRQRSAPAAAAAGSAHIEDFHSSGAVASARDPEPGSATAAASGGAGKGKRPRQGRGGGDRDSDNDDDNDDDDDDDDEEEEEEEEEEEVFATDRVRGSSRRNGSRRGPVEPGGSRSQPSYSRSLANHNPASPTGEPRLAAEMCVHFDVQEARSQLLRARRRADGAGAASGRPTTRGDEAAVPGGLGASTPASIIASESLEQSTRAARGDVERELARVLPKHAFADMDVCGQFNLGFLIAKARRHERDPDSSGGAGARTEGAGSVPDGSVGVATRAAAEARGGDLFIIDQHAADEKHRFETYQQTTQIHTQRLLAPLPLQLTAADELLVIDHLHVFHANGFHIAVNASAPPTQRLRLEALPFSKDTVFGVSDVHELVTLLSEAPGSHCRLPKLRSMFAMRACRSAVMIGTALDAPKMLSVVRHLATLEQP